MTSLPLLIPGFPCLFLCGNPGVGAAAINALVVPECFAIFGDSDHGWMLHSAAMPFMDAKRNPNIQTLNPKPCSDSEDGGEEVYEFESSMEREDRIRSEEMEAEEERRRDGERLEGEERERERREEEERRERERRLECERAAEEERERERVERVERMAEEERERTRAVEAERMKRRERER